MALIVDEIGRQRLHEEYGEHDAPHAQDLRQRIRGLRQFWQSCGDIAGAERQGDCAGRDQQGAGQVGHQQRHIWPVIAHEFAGTRP
ncbi:hypothetical protein D3C72_2206870 [compost metagenome]